MYVYVLMILIGMDKHANRITVLVGKYGINCHLNVNVKKDITLMERCVCCASMDKNGEKEVKHVNVLPDILGMETIAK